MTSLFFSRHQEPRHSGCDHGPPHQMIYAIHELNLFVGHLVELILVALGLEGKPEHTAKGYDRWIEFVAARIRIIVPRKGDVREPKQEREDPEILVWGKPITRCKKQSKHYAFYIKGKWPTWKDTTSHFLFLFTIKNQEQNYKQEQDNKCNFQIKLRGWRSGDYVGQCFLI
jgi:hypothetical protein